MSSTGDYLDKGIAYIKAATAYDNEKNYEDAFKSYEAGLQFFLLAIRSETNEKNRATISAKVDGYMKRAETLKQFLDEEKEKQQQKKLVEASGSGSSSKKSKGSSSSSSNEDSDEDEEDPEKSKMRSSLAESMITKSPNVHWDDVAGLESAKEALNEAVILPMKFPHMFKGKRRPWRGILLYGPPGTGKTYLAKAVATESGSKSFYNISASSLLSKWLGESEKMVKELFAMAHENGPSIIFIDEVDSLCSTRSDSDNDSARRIKNEILVQMDGVGSDSGSSVLVLGATNMPWQIDAAVRRRFERRIYIALPEEGARERMFHIHLGDTPNTLEQDDFKTLAEMSEGYSGSDIANVVRDALMEPIRTVQLATHFKKIVAPDREDPQSEKEYLTPCSPSDPEGVEMSWTEIKDGSQLYEPPVTMNDFLKAVKKTRSSVGKDDMILQEKFTEEYGTGD